MRKHIKGSVATYCEFLDGSMQTYTRPLRVLRSYIAWGRTPRHWSDIRASELSAAIAWVMQNMPAELIESQERIENREE